MFYSDPLQANMFSVEVMGLPVPSFMGWFTGISGIGSEYSVLEHKTFNPEIGMPLVQYMPGRPTYAPITFKHGLTRDMAFWLWHYAVAVAQGSWTRALVSVELKKRDYDGVIKFQLVNAWPSKISDASLDSASSAFIIEDITFRYEHLILDPFSVLIPNPFF